MMVGKTVDDMYMGMLPEDVYPSDKDQPTFKAYLTVVVRDASGNIVKVHKQWSHSPTANFMSIMLPRTYYLNTGQGPPITTTGGTTYYYHQNTFPLYYPNTNSNCATYLIGIEVGNSNQTNQYGATNLASPIANGSGAGQLVYGQTSVSSSPIASGNSVYFYISQTFNNSSGGTITITEVGIFVNMCLYLTSGSNTSGTYLVWYDVLSSAISVPNGGSVTIYYTFAVNP